MPRINIAAIKTRLVSVMSRLRRAMTLKRLFVTMVWLCLLLVVYVIYLDFTIRSEFEGRRWALPARVYARPLELYPGMALTQRQLAQELERLNYRQTAAKPDGLASFSRQGNELSLMTRAFQFHDAAQGPQALRISFAEGRIAQLQSAKNGADVTLARLEPMLIGSIYPAHKEDRVLVQLAEAPAELVNAIITIEDRKFYEHHGIDPRGIARAVVATASGKGVQGGSTLTQQLVKNYFLTSARSLRRKFTEMIMAVLLELHYDKDEIMQSYINEIYMGQDGKRAIHGFGLASHFYFGQPLNQLELHQSALLVAMLKGPNFYEPRRYPERVLKRRNLVLMEMQKLEFITPEQLRAAKAKPLDVIAKAPSGATAYPAFLSLVQRQLLHDYRDEDLRSEGLRIFTTLDPQVQASAENTLTQRLARLEKQKRIPADTLQGAVVVTSTQNGEVQALVSGRDPRFQGFNRALDAQRPIGSLIKPIVYLTALADHGYTLISPLDDNQLIYKQRGTEDWMPMNYDKEFHGQVPLRTALALSYNVSTARLGLEIGVSQVMEMTRRLGVDRALPTNASSLLGAVEMRPIEVAQMYQTLASGGFRAPLRAIRDVTLADGELLQRYPLAVQQVAAAEPVYLITHALQDVVRVGTARGLASYLPAEIQAAGKTGTTDDLRDSWFAGFTGDRLAVVWVGRDDNQPTRLTGSSGAMTVWGTMMRQLDPEPLHPPQPDGIELVWIEPETGLLADATCPGALQIPFRSGTAPQESAACAKGKRKRIKGWFKSLFD